MTEGGVTKAAAKKRSGFLRDAWRRVRQPLAQSRFAKAATVSLLTGGLRFVRLTNPIARESTALSPDLLAQEPMILALWHGQHILAPAYYPSTRKLAAMVSRSADAELNAKVLERYGIVAVRGSGGRQRGNDAEKGGAGALVRLKKLLDEGYNVCLIADPHGRARQAGEGIVTLAKLSGRPILPVAITTSRRKVLDRTWDKTTINLPFGRAAVYCGQPIHVPHDAKGEAFEDCRRQVTDALNEAFEAANRIADKRS